MIKLSFTGDIMSSKLQNEWARTLDGKHNYSQAFADLDFSDVDYLCGNLETPIAGEKLGVTNASTNFNTPREFLLALKSVGFKFFSTANNHALDRGVEGIINTINELNDIGFDFTGTFNGDKTNDYLIKEIKGTKIAFLSFTYGVNTSIPISNDVCNYINALTLGKDYYGSNFKPKKTNFINRIFRATYYRSRYICGKCYDVLWHLKYPKCVRGTFKDTLDPMAITREENRRLVRNMIETIKKARQESDLLVLCLHIGGQFNKEIGAYTQFIYNYLQKEDIDIIVGNHPHCVLPGFVNGNKFYGYSLGNFTFTPRDGWYNNEVLPDYSILLHAYIDECTKCVERYTYSILKTIRHPDNGSTTHFAFDLIEREKNLFKRICLMRDYRRIQKTFAGRIDKGIRKEHNINER